MVERLDALSVRESNDKSFFTRIGVAFPAKQGAGWTVLLDAMPAPVEGQFKILLREPLPPRDGSQGSPQQPARNAQAFDSDLDDNVPFASSDPRFEGRVG